jgi:hypothetical protein
MEQIRPARECRDESASRLFKYTHGFLCGQGAVDSMSSLRACILLSSRLALQERFVTANSAEIIRPADVVLHLPRRSQTTACGE